MTHEDFMRFAIDKAREGIAGGQTPFGTCIVRGGEVVCVTHNCVWGSTDITAHAEIRALREACSILGTVDLTGCEVYTTCEPCPMCFSACHWARVSRIYYGATISVARAAGFNELTIPSEEMKRLGNSPVELVPGILPQETSALFEEWIAAGRSGAY